MAGDEAAARDVVVLEHTESEGVIEKPLEEDAGESGADCESGLEAEEMREITGSAADEVALDVGTKKPQKKKAKMKTVQKKSDSNSDEDEELDEDDGDAEVFQSLEAYDWKRRAYHISVALMLSLIIVVVAILIAPAYPEWRDLELSEGDLEEGIKIEADGCHIRFFPDSSSARVRVRGSAGVDAAIKDRVLTVESSADVTVRYSNYECDIYIYYGDVKLGKTEVVSTGYLSSTFSAVGAKWDAASGSLDFKVTHAETTSMLAHLDDCEMPPVLTAQGGSGSGRLAITRSTFPAGAQVNLTAASLASSPYNLVVDAKTTGQVVVRALGNSGFGSSWPWCFTGTSVSCSSGSVGNCSEVAVGAGPIATGVNIAGCDAATCNVHVSAYDDTTNVEAYRGDLQAVGDVLPLIDLGMSDTARIADKWRAPSTAEQVTLELGGPGSLAPEGNWVWTARGIFSVLPRAYLDLFSFGLLAPVSYRVNASLSPGFCVRPQYLDSEAGKLAAEIHMHDLVYAKLVTAGVAVPNPESVILHQQFDEDDVIPVNTRIVTDDVSGLRYSRSANLDDAPQILALLVINAFLTLLSTAYIVVLALRRFRRVKNDRVEEWGDAGFGRRWPENRKEFHARTGPFWLSEFLISFPRERRSLLKSFSAGLLHISLIVVLVAPMLTCGALFQAAIAEEFGTIVGMPIFSIACYAVAGLYGAIALVYLIIYYAQLPWSIMKVFSWTFSAASTVIIVLDALYVVNLSYWLLLGALIKPNEILPYACVVIVLVFHTIATAVRIRDLTAKNLDDPSGVAVPEGQTVTLTGKENSAAAVSLVKKSSLLEMRDLSVREQIVREIVVFLIMVSFFAFLLTGFTALQTSDLSAAISSLMVFLVGGGVNAPTIAKKRDLKKEVQQSKLKSE